MYCNNLNFPNQLLDAIKTDRFVVFAGAGASVDPPTSLPNFENLAKKIAEDTIYNLTKKDSCEVFLGKLKAKGIPVNKQAATILSSTCREHNKLHEAIVDLFPSPESIKIVTTNYDQMFEHVLTSRGISPLVYNSPALPLGKDINGIVHIHGNVDDYRYMVVTDEDFGKAYLTEGYVSKFLVQLFETYTVLFIGYSYNDTILRYLTRAMSRLNSGKKFILTKDEKSDWDALGIIPISYYKKSHASAREALVKLGLYVKKGLIDWNNQFLSMRDAPPKDLTIDSEIEYCLSNKEITKILVQCINGKDWIDYLDDKKVFEECFSKGKNLSEGGNYWGYWLCNNFIGSEDDALLHLFFKHNNTFNDEFANILVFRLLKNSNIKSETLTEYVILVENYIHESWMLSKLIERLYNINQHLLCFRLYTKLFKATLSPNTIYSLNNSYEYTHAFQGEPHDLFRIWNVIKDVSTKNLSYSIITFVQEKIQELHNLYSFVDQATDEYEPPCMSMLIIEKHEEPIYRDEDLHALENMYLEGSLELQNQNPELLRSSLYQSIHSNSILLRKIALKTIRLTNVFTASEKLEFILAENSLDNLYFKEQTFLLAKNIFSSLSTKEKNRFLDSIENLGSNSDNSYKVYQWCNWLQEEAPNNSRIQKIISKILSQHQFTPSLHPERDPDSLIICEKDESPLSEERLKVLSIEDAVHYISTFNGDPIHGPNRYGLLDVFSVCISKDYHWAYSVTSELINQKNKQSDVWNHVYEGLTNSNFTINESIALLELLVDHVSEHKYDYFLSNYLLQTIRKDSAKESFNDIENKLLSITKTLWNKRSHSKPHLNRTIDVAINSPIGNILLSLIYCLSYIEDLSIPQKYKDIFEQSLKLRSWERHVAICILVGHFNFFCYRDKEWSDTNLVHYLIKSDNNTFSSAWDGLIYFSRRIDTNTADIITPIFYKAIKHINWLDEHTKHGFIELLLTLLIFVVDKPTLKFIPELYKYASEKDINLFIHTIERRLNNYSEADNKKWWDKWLKRFFENRKSNKPIPLYESEFSNILNLLPELDFVFEEAVSIICKGSIPNKIDNIFWHSLLQKNLAAKYPISIAAVMIKVLNSVEKVDPFKEDIKKIIEALDGIEDKKKKQIQEAALKHSIFLI
ncbi:MAG: DUF4020 domain-containing protein [Lachnospiraceae bacterium]|nr:DUF4020 domain-containing protein [Lachnospiraceae bacterium]